MKNDKNKIQFTSVTLGKCSEYAHLMARLKRVSTRKGYHFAGYLKRLLALADAEGLNARVPKKKAL